ncbi:MAG: hypothetical protein AAGA58_13055 [Verrucomicrobiota bacterium]
MKTLSICVVVLAILMGPRAKGAVVLVDFEAVTSGVVVLPYFEDGFELSVDTFAAVFAPGGGFPMTGNPTAYVAFEEIAVITLALEAGGSFDLNQVMLGPNDFAAASSVEITLTGSLAGGGTVMQTFSGLTTATVVNPVGFDDVTSVTFTTSDDAGIDNIVLDVIPEPALSSLLLISLFAVAFRRRS